MNPEVFVCLFVCFAKPDYQTFIFKMDQNAFIWLDMFQY